MNTMDNHRWSRWKANTEVLSLSLPMPKKKGLFLLGLVALGLCSIRSTEAQAATYLGFSSDPCTLQKAATLHSPAPILFLIHCQYGKTSRIRAAKGYHTPRYGWRAEASPYAMRLRYLSFWRSAHLRAISLRPAKPWTAYFEHGILCIHSHEGSWQDTGDPYWGGLQMNKSFMLTHGPDMVARYGWANAWPIAIQMLVAWRAYSGTGPGNYTPRGFAPWPGTRTMCGV